MRYIIFLLYALFLMFFVQFCGDSAEAAPDLLELKAENTRQIAIAYDALSKAEARQDWDAVRRQQTEIRRLYDENVNIHSTYQKKSPVRKDDSSSMIDEFRAINNETADASEEEDDNLAQQLVRVLWFGVILRFLLWLVSVAEWLVGWIPVIGPLVGLILVLIAVLVMILGYGLPGIIPFIFVSL